MEEMIRFLLAQAELEKDKLALIELGLTQEEIEGYGEFFLENYFIRERHTITEEVLNES